MQKSDAIELFGGRVKLLADVLNQTRASVYQWPDILPLKTEFTVIGAAVKAGILEINYENENLLRRSSGQAEDDEIRQMEQARRRAKVSSFLRRGEAQKNNGQ